MPSSRAIQPLPKSQHTSQAGLNNITRSLNKYLRVQNHDAAFNFLHSALDSLDPYNLHFGYEFAIPILLKWRDLLGASHAYSRMVQDGLLPSVALRCRMLLVDTISDSPSEDNLLAVLDEIFRYNPGDDVCFRDLMRLLASTMQRSPSFFRRAFTAYTESSNSSHSVSEATTRLMRYIIQFFTDHPPPLTVADADLDEWSKDTLRYLVKHDPDTAANFHSIVSTHPRLEPSLVLSNILITSQLRSSRYDRAFDIYAQLKNATHPCFMPDGHTFSALFGAIRKMDGPRNLHSRKIRTSPKVVSPRTLYADMLVIDRARRRMRLPRVISSSVLEAAIRTFMVKQDYAAAHTALLSFDLRDVPLTMTVYRAVVGYLVDRMETEAPQAQMSYTPQKFWTYRFLGEPSPIPQNSTVLLNAALSYGAPTGREEKGPNQVPTARMLLGVDEPSTSSWNTTPLRRILTQAITALQTSNSLLKPGTFLNLTISDAKTEMVVPLATGSMASQKST